VLKAYKELEAKGLATGRPGQGTFITGTLEPVTLPELAGLRRGLLSWLKAAEEAGLDAAGVAALLANVTQDYYGGRVAARNRERRKRGRRVNIVETGGLGKNYGRTWALPDCTFAMPEGHLAALVGPNGAGKTTLLHHPGRTE